MPFELHPLFFYYNFFVEILKLKRQDSNFQTEYHRNRASTELFTNKEMEIEKALPYFYVKKDLLPEGNNMSYPKFEIIFSVSKD
ncbi:hypothetical protein CN286_17555 [Bacillus anthracis]|nr:hypothetical protein CN286_17555 [Bacillus anthracis]PFM43766.1 hypothetical protein COJ45_27740 [Bacillus cereus]PGS23854.1 hypothetical protein COC59_17790 [Bacillus cereus]